MVVGLENLVVSQVPEFPTVAQIADVCAQSAPCAQIKAETEARERLEADRAQTAARMLPQGTYGNNYAWGNCTSYVASRIAVPGSMGNAANWLNALLASGWRGGEARRGAIAHTYAGPMGHVAVVEAVQGDMVLVSEMNYNGLGLVDFRWTPISDWNYIYL